MFRTNLKNNRNKFLSLYLYTCNDHALIAEGVLFKILIFKNEQFSRIRYNGTNSVCGFVDAKSIFYCFRNIRSVIIVWLPRFRFRFDRRNARVPAIKKKSSPGTVALTSFCVYQRVGRDGTKPFTRKIHGVHCMRLKVYGGIWSVLRNAIG